MPKWRKLHTKTVDSLDLNDMPDDFTRLLWVLLPLKLDRCGRGLDNPAWVRSKIFPLRQDVSVEMVSEAMNWYEARGMIERYEKRGRNYFWIPTWHKYQGSTSREAVSDFPAPDSYIDPNNDTTSLTSSSRPTREQVKSRSCSDVDVDVDTDVEEDSDTDVDVERDVCDLNAFSLVEKATASTLNPILADRIGALIDECEEHRQDLPPPSKGSDITGDKWVCAAIMEAVDSTDRISINYIKAILDRWKQEGFKAPFKRGDNGKRGGNSRKGQSRRYSRDDLPDPAEIRRELQADGYSEEQIRRIVAGEPADDG